MQKDLRDTPLYREAQALFTALWQPGSGRVTDAVEVSAAPNGRDVVFTGTLMDKFEGGAQTRICRTDLSTGDTQVLTFGPGADRLAKYSPDGKKIAFLSDRHRSGDAQLYFIEPTTGAVRPGPRVDGWVEYFHWSPDGASILLAVAGHGADVSGGQGATTTKSSAAAASWMPDVHAGAEDSHWRTAWICDVTAGSVRKVPTPGLNLWEMNWCGNAAIAAVTSKAPGEGSWFTAVLHVIDARSGAANEVYAPKDRLGWPAASPSGKTLAIAEAVCSDRWILSGDLRLIDVASGKVAQVSTNNVEVTHAEWRSEQHLLLAGHRGFETVIGIYDTSTKAFTETWASREITGTARYIQVAGLNETGDCVLAAEGYIRAPEIGVIRQGKYSTVTSLDAGYNAEATRVIGAAEALTWTSTDGLEIGGWLIKPKQGKAPYPLILHVHGGPVFHWRPQSFHRNAVNILMLLARGYAVFRPNPRGSSGSTQEFTRCVIGDIGGMDAQDVLSGLDMLINNGTVDAKRVGVTGGSYGGYMTSWLVTQAPEKFAAAISVVPSTNRISQRHIANHPNFVDMFVGDNFRNLGGKFFTRSPVFHAHKVRTPTLNICGALDRCTPRGEAVQFHNALLENGVTSALAIYPLEGHGVRTFPAAFDYAARVVDWFDTHMKA